MRSMLQTPGCDCSQTLSHLVRESFLICVLCPLLTFPQLLRPTADTIGSSHYCHCGSWVRSGLLEQGRCDNLALVTAFLLVGLSFLVGVHWAMAQFGNQALATMVLFALAVTRWIELGAGALTGTQPREIGSPADGT